MHVIFQKFSPVALIALALTSFAQLSSATTFTLTQTSLSGITNIGTVTTTQVGGDVLVSITLKPGFLFMAQGGMLMFDSRHGLKLSARSLSGFGIRGFHERVAPITTMGGFTFTQIFRTSVHDGDEKDLDMRGPGLKREFDGERFDSDDFRSIKFHMKDSDKDDDVFVSTLSFMVLDSKVSQLTGFGLKFCIADENTCSRTFGIATSVPSTPEPGTLALLGTGLVGIATLVRRSRSRQD